MDWPKFQLREKSRSGSHANDWRSVRQVQRSSSRLSCSLSYRKFTIDSQGEYLFDTKRSASFFYNWSEASYSPVEWLRAGIVIQRTKAYQTSLDTQRGLLVAFTIRGLILRPTFSISAGQIPQRSWRSGFNSDFSSRLPAFA